MGAMDGVTMAKQVRRDNETVQIVFVTGYFDYIAEDYAYRREDGVYVVPIGCLKD